MAGQLDFEYINNDKQLRDFCAAISNEKVVGFDTEFVSENRFRPELCLLQIAAGSELAIVDTLAVKDLSPFWDHIASPGVVTIAHAAREEFLFCFRQSGKKPSELFDLQIAAGMVGIEYPVAYGNLVNRICGIVLGKGETRTDWSRRPLTDRQIQYALQDVLHLRELYDALRGRLEDLDRESWLASETETWLEHLAVTETEPQWRRVSGISGLSRRALGIVREVYLWRNLEAKKKNRSPKRILPDDLLIEIAKRGESDEQRLKSIRGIERRISNQYFKPICQAIDAGNDIPDADLPSKPARHRTQNLGLLGQFVTTTLNLVCRDANIASNLVGTASDVRELAAYKLGLLKHKEHPPKLLSGWRKQFVEEWLDDVLGGKVSLRVGNPKSDQPLVLEWRNKKN